MFVRVSVVVPAYDAAATLGDCLRALANQTLARTNYEVIVVDDGSRDATPAIATDHGVRLIRRENGGPAAARNSGWRAAGAEWVAFTDADCLPARAWLVELLRAVDAAPANGAAALGAAGRTVGYDSKTPAARFVDLSGGLDAERHLSHPRFPFAPSGNLMYSRSALAAVGGFDERYRTYEACDLHQRLRERADGPFFYVPRAVVLHKHRTTWAAYWRQQYGYGAGYGRFMLDRARDVPWSIGDEARAWRELFGTGIGSLRPGDPNRRLLERGNFVKRLAQRSAFATTYWNPAERAR